MDSILDSVVRDNLIAGPYPIVRGYGSLNQSQTLVRGTVLGKITVAAGATDADDGNTGNGTLSGYALTATGGPPIVGTYKATCTVHVDDGGIFEITDPYNNYVGTLTEGVQFTAGGITLKIDAGEIDFVVGDFFTMIVSAGTGYYKKLDKASTDGSQVFEGILLEDVTTGSGDYFAAPIALSGQFHSQGLVFGGSTVYTDILDAMRDKNCYVVVSDSDENIGG